MRPILDHARGLLAALLCSAVVAACGPSQPAPAKFADITFQQFAKYRFAVGKIEIVREYVPPLKPPNIEHLFPVTPMQVAERWAQDRLVAAGGTSELRYVIKRASAVESELPRTTGIRGAFTKDQAQRYDAVIEVEIEIRNERGYRDGVAAARWDVTQSVAEDVTVAQREHVWFQMSEALGRGLNKELDSRIQASLTGFLVNP